MANATYRGRIIVNDTDYTGSFVDPNPSGVATDDLNTVGIDGKIFNIADGGGGGGSAIIVNAMKYSTSEQVVGIGENGKPLYQKTVTSSTLAAETGETVLTGIDSLKVISLRTNRTHPFYISTYDISGSGTEYGLVEHASNGDVKLYNAGRSASIVIEAVLQYTKTTDTAGSGGFQAYGFTPVIYSTEEREVGVWLDNKPLYKKSYILQSLIVINNNGTNINSYIDNVATIEQITNAEACNSLASLANLQTSNIFVGKSNNNLTAYCAEAGSFNIITLWYTKTTDVAGSGKYNTLGVPNVHYSTDEQIIGTWIDGKPLYQKTYIINETIYNQDKTIDISDLNIKKYVNGYGTFLRNVNWATPILFIDTPFNLYESNINRSYLRHGKTNNTIDYGIFLGKNETATDITITIQYTKTTD